MEKLKNLILYLAHRGESDPHFGMTKLNKLLFLIDFNAYASWGKPLTEATYVHRTFGPAPKQLLTARDQLMEAGQAVIEERDFFGRTQKRIKPLVAPDLSLFTGEEFALIEHMIKRHESMSATDISEASHELAPWQLTREGEEIPFFTVFVSKKEPATLDDKIWAMEQLEALGRI